MQEIELIRIDNPGNLYGKVNLKNFPNETDYRNPNIAEIMLNLGYVNRFGSGVNTVSTLLEENGSVPAEFLLGDYTTFKVVVQNADVIENGTNVTNDEEIRKEAVVEMMRLNKRVSVTQIAKELNVTRRTIFRIIDILKSQNRIKRVGDLKSGTWEVIK